VNLKIYSQTVKIVRYTNGGCWSLNRNFILNHRCRLSIAALRTCFLATVVFTCPIPWFFMFRSQHIIGLSFIHEHRGKQINKGKTPGKGTREEKRNDQKSKQKITPESARCTRGSPKRRNHQT
jgi:hypothetical protein